MTKSDLLQQIGTRAHLDPYSYYESQIKDAFEEAVNELSLIVPLSDVAYLVKLSTYTVTNGKIALPSDFSKVIRMYLGGDSRNQRFVLVDNAKWQWLGIDTDHDPPPNTIYYYISGAEILFYKSSSVNNKTLNLSYLSAITESDLASDFELTNTAGRFTKKFTTIVKNRAVEILTAEMRGEQQ
jgi:hypothetical protein